MREHEADYKFMSEEIKRMETKLEVMRKKVKEIEESASKEPSQENSEFLSEAHSLMSDISEHIESIKQSKTRMEELIRDMPL